MEEVSINPTLGALIIALLAVLAFVIFKLFKFERALVKKLEGKDAKMKHKLSIRKKISNLRNSKDPAEKVLAGLDRLAKGTIHQYIHPGERVEYSKLSEHFTSTGQQDLASFCNNMIKTEYSQDKPRRDQVLELIKEFDSVFNKYVLKSSAEKENNKKPKLRKTPKPRTRKKKVRRK